MASEYELIEKGKVYGVIMPYITPAKTDYDGQLITRTLYRVADKIEKLPVVAAIPLSAHTQAVSEAYERGRAEAVKQGHWIDKIEGTYNRRKTYCSVCNQPSGIGGIKSNQHKPYCPNCGAKLDGGNNG